jgi:hypothetical protein
MSAKTKSTHELPGGQTEDKKNDDLEDDEMVNDSLGTVGISDSTGSDEQTETGDAKKGNTPKRED